MKLNEAIKELQKLQEEHGDVELNVYCSFSKETKSFDEIYFDDEQGKASIGIYA